MTTLLKTNFAVEAKHEAFFSGGKIQFSTDGSTMFCQCGCSVKVLDVATGKQISNVLADEESDVTSFVLSPDGLALVVATRNLLLRQWDWREKAVKRTWKAVHVAPVSCMTFDTTSTLLATGGCDSTTKVWDVIRQYCTHNLKGHQGVVSTVAFHPDSSRLLLFTAADDYHVRVWDLASSACLAELSGHFSVVTALQITPDGSTMYSGSRDNVVNVWDIVKFVKTKTIPVYESVEGLVLLPADRQYPQLKAAKGSQHFITAGSKGVLRVWHADSATCVSTQPDVGGAAPAAIVAMSCVADCVAVVTFDHNVRIYRTDDLRLRKQFAGNNGDVLDVTFVGPGDSHVAVATNSEQIKVFCVSDWSCDMLVGHTGTVLCLAASATLQLLASSSKDSTIRLWKMDAAGRRFSCVAVASGHTHAVTAIAFAKAGGRFLVSGSEDRTMKLWPLPDDLAAEDGGVVTVKVISSRLTEKAHDKDVNGITVAPNDKLVATASQDKTAKLWSVDKLALHGVLRGHKRGIWCTQFSPVDQCLATASADGTVKIWSLADYTCVKTFEGHDSSVLRVLFLTRGMQLLTSGSDGLVKLWTIKSGECVKTLDAHDDKVWALAVDRTESLVVTGAGDANVIVWKDVTVEEVEETRQKHDDLILKEQELSNLLQQKQYLKAIGLSITLEQPLKVLGIMTDILDGDDGAEKLDTTLACLRDDQIDAVLRFVARWNTNSRHCRVAQRVLTMLLGARCPEALAKLPSMRASVEALLPYTERHFQRMSRLMQQSTFVDYTWQCMRLTEVIRPEIEEDEEMEVKEEREDGEDRTAGDEEEMEVDAAPQATSSGETAEGGVAAESGEEEEEEDEEEEEAGSEDGDGESEEEVKSKDARAESDDEESDDDEEIVSNDVPVASDEEDMGSNEAETESDDEEIGPKDALAAAKGGENESGEEDEEIGSVEGSEVRSSDEDSGSDGADVSERVNGFFDLEAGDGSDPDAAGSDEEEGEVGEREEDEDEDEDGDLSDSDEDASGEDDDEDYVIGKDEDDDDVARASEDDGTNVVSEKMKSAKASARRQMAVKHVRRTVTSPRRTLRSLSAVNIENIPDGVQIAIGKKMKGKRKGKSGASSDATSGKTSGKGSRQQQQKESEGRTRRGKGGSKSALRLTTASSQRSANTRRRR